MKNKILTISIIFILLSFIFISNNSFAARYDIDVSSIVGDRSWCVFKADNDFYLAVGSNHDTKLFFYNSLGLEELINIYGSSAFPYDLYKLNTSSMAFEFHSRVTHFNANDIEFLYSNKDILVSPQSDVFFFKTPVQAISLELNLTLVQELEKVEVVEVFKKMTKNVVISLLVCLIGFLSLRKGWTFLKKALKKA